MKPYFEDEKAGIVIYHGDCREVLPQLPKGWCSSCSCELADESILAIHLAGGHDVGPFVDAVVSDPPYGMNYNTDGNRFTKVGRAMKSRDLPMVIGDDQPFDPRRTAAHLEAEHREIGPLLG